MKIQSLLTASLIFGSVCGADVWTFSPENVSKGSKNTVITPGPEGVKISSDARVNGKAFIKIDPSARYKVSFYGRKVSGLGRIWVVMESRNAKKQLVYPASLQIRDENLGTLAVPAKAGDKILQITGAEKWVAVKGSKVLAFNAKADKSDLPNLNLSPTVKSISADGKVELSRPLRESYKAGTLVRCHQNTPQFVTLIRVDTPAAWKYFDTEISGMSSGVERGKFNFGTEFVRLRLITDGEVEIKDLKMEKIETASPESPKKKR